MTATSIGFCQNKYPQKKVIDGDTITLITQQQVKKIRLLDFDLKTCDTFRQRKDVKIDSLVSLVNAKKQVILLQKQEIDNYIIKEKDLKKDNEKLLNISGADKKKAARLKVWLTVAEVYSGVATSAAVIFYFVGKKN